MKGKQSTFLRVGLFVGIGFAVIFFVVATIGRERSLFEAHYTLKSFFTDVSGLREGSFVKLSGLNIGYVDKLNFFRDKEKNGIEVTLMISKDFQDQIREDSRIMIQTQGLLGDKYIYITLGSETAPPLQDGDFVEGEQEGGWANLAQEGTETLREVREAAKSIRRTLDNIRLNKEGKENLGDILVDLKDGAGHLRTLLAGLERGEGTLGALIKDPSLYHDVRSILGHVNRNKILKSWIRSARSKSEKNQ